MAVGFENGSIVLFRGDVMRERYIFLIVNMVMLHKLCSLFLVHRHILSCHRANCLILSTLINRKPETSQLQSYINMSVFIILSLFCQSHCIGK